MTKVNIVTINVAMKNSDQRHIVANDNQDENNQKSNHNENYHQSHRLKFFNLNYDFEELDDLNIMILIK